jgi:hypothetical protein
MWPIKDKFAANFASVLYVNLKKFAIGESMKNARNLMKAEYPDSEGWIPYSLFDDAMRRIRAEA